MRLNDKQIKDVVRWIKRNHRNYRQTFNPISYDCTVMAESCGDELFAHQGHYDSILREVEYYVVNKD